MLMTPSAALETFFGVVETYPEIAGKRVLVMGVTAAHGVDVARAFAEHRARLILQIDTPCAETDALGEVLAPVASELTIFSGALTTADEIVTFARRAVSAYGGLDAVVILVPLTLGAAADGDIQAVEQRISEVLLAPCLVARIAANRMRLLGADGLVLHIATMPKSPSATEMAFAQAAKATLTAMTRSDAATWGVDGIRVNAIAPATGSGNGHGLAGEADVAALALYLASGRGTTLSGHVFEADVRA